MPQLNRDILREVFYEIANSDGFRFSFVFGSNVDKFMMAGKEPFNIVLDHCMKAKDVVFLKDGIIATLPNVEPKLLDLLDTYNFAVEHVTGTVIHRLLKFFKPISIAVASSMKSLDIRSFTPEFIPMLKSIDQEMEEVYIRYRQLKLILEACINIPNVRNGVTIHFCQNCEYGIKSFAIPCHKLTMKNALFNSMCQRINLSNHHLDNIRDLTVRGRFERLNEFFKELKDFAAFLSINFPNLETLNVLFLLTQCRTNNFQDLNNVAEMANFFKLLPVGVKGEICFKIMNPQSRHVDLTQYPGVQRGNNEYYKIVPITDTLDFKMSFWYEH